MNGELPRGTFPESRIYWEIEPPSRFTAVITVATGIDLL